MPPDPERQPDSEARALRDYATVTAGYWCFTLTDGALRMLVLLHLYALGYAPLEIASMFAAFELAGVLTNLFAGWLGAARGLRATLLAGLSLQVLALGVLPSLVSVASLIGVLGTQAASGVAKDLTKMSAKSYLKLLVPDHDARGLLRWVTLLTGSKNALKGAGFFLGGALLAGFGFELACYAMAGALLLTGLACAALLPAAAGRAQAAPTARSFLSRDPRVNWLSAARLFLFGARDVWFVLALPVFLAATLGWSQPAVGGFLALWVIGYGSVQAAAPKLVARAGHAPNAMQLVGWTPALLAPLGLLFWRATAGAPSGLELVAALGLFGAVFAVNSALHSFLIVSYSKRERVALDVGFYYAANATGRLVGTLLSGALFQAAGQGSGGLAACLLGSGALVLFSALGAACLVGAERRQRTLLVDGT